MRYVGVEAEAEAAPAEAAASLSTPTGEYRPFGAALTPQPLSPGLPPNRRERGALKTSSTNFSLFSRREGGEAGRRGPG